MCDGRLSLVVGLSWLLTVLPTVVTGAAAAPVQGMSADAERRGVAEFVLDNGLKVLVKADHRAPVVTVQVWYRVGGAYEPNGLTGISHMVEHMMFQGTETRGPGVFSRIVAQHGGRQNAFTGRDYTGYYQRLSADHLGLAFELEADRMRHLKLDADEFAKERRVVEEERRGRVEDRPRGKAREQLFATAFNTAPYRNPVVGWMDDIRNYTLTDLQHWYDTWYAPNNAIVVVVGDVTADQVRREAERRFGVLRPTPALPALKPRREPAQRGERRVVLREKAQLPYLLMGWKVPTHGSAALDWEPYALDLLAGVLDGGRSTRLPREVIRGQALAAAAGADYDGFQRFEGLFIVHGTPSEGVDIAALEAALRDQVDALRAAPVAAAQLQRIKTQAEASLLFSRDSMDVQANLLGALEASGLGWRMLDRYLDRLHAVTAAEVQAVARRYLRDDMLTVVRVEPILATAATTADARRGEHR